MSKVDDTIETVSQFMDKVLYAKALFRAGEPLPVIEVSQPIFNHYCKEGDYFIYQNVMVVVQGTKEVILKRLNMTIDQKDFNSPMRDKNHEKTL